jgi:hypothetical protein
MKRETHVPSAATTKKRIAATVKRSHANTYNQPKLQSSGSSVACSAPKHV